MPAQIPGLKAVECCRFCDWSEWHDDLQRVCRKHDDEVLPPWWVCSEFVCTGGPVPAELPAPVVEGGQ